jgi:hypothetical protein
MDGTMQQCHRCKTDMLDETARQSFPQIEKLLKLEHRLAKATKAAIKSEGPLCYRCLASWYARLSAKKYFK